MTKQEMLEKQAQLNKKLILSIIINSSFTVFECAVGFAIGSLALMSDGAQNLTDTLSLMISLFARLIAKRNPTEHKSFGYGRATILAALINGLILITLAFYIFKQAYLRFLNPEPVEGSWVMLIGFFGILVNGGVALMFVNHRDDISIRSAFLNMIYDALASAGALCAGIVIMLTGSTIIDPIVGIIIGTLLVTSAWRILADVVHILLEGVPATVSLSDVQLALKNNPEILSVDDLHIWAISSFDSALTCHISIAQENLSKSVEIVRQMKEILENKFSIHHSTIEVEVRGCTPKQCSLFKYPL